MKILGYYAHRGLHNLQGGIPENTLSAFKASCKAGYGIELDVQLSANGTAYVFHDKNLKRMTGIDANFSEMDDRKLDKIYMLEERIPKLSEVLACVAGDVPIILELKSYQKDYQAVCLAVANQLDHYQGASCIESFDPRIVYWFKKHRPRMIRGQLVMPMNKYDRKVWGILMPTLLTNLFTKPHFTAFDLKMGTTRFGQCYYKWIINNRVGWTSKEDNVYPLFDAIIFEGYIPQNI